LSDQCSFDLILALILTLGRTSSHNSTMVHGGGGGGGIEPLPWVFAVFQYFGEDLPLVESL